MMNDIALDNETGDLYFGETGDLRLLNGIDYVRQNISIGLKWFLGEWYLNTLIGIPYYEKILIKNPNHLDIVNYIKREILLAEGVKDIDKFNLEIKGQRTILVSFSANTDYGKLQFDEIYTVT